MDIAVIEYAGGPNAHLGPEMMAIIAHGDTLATDAAVVLVVETDTLASMVNHIITTALARGGAIDVLRIHSHGQPGTLLSGRLSEEEIRRNAGALGRLARHFAPGGQVFLHSCYVGQNGRFLSTLARVWGVPVTASVEEQIAGAGATHYFIGTTLTGDPDGHTVHINRAGIPRGPNPHAPAGR